MNRTKMYLCAALMMAALCTTSCSKDDDELDVPEIVSGTTVVDGETYTRGVGGTVAKYIDLGLPSGTLWAEHNLGATKATEYGAYIVWGENGSTEQNYNDGIKSTGYDWNSDYLYHGTDNKGTFDKYVTDSQYGTVDNKTTLDPCDDAATVNWGSNWRTPSNKQLQELIDNCTLTWFEKDNDTFDGVAGYRVTSNINGKSLFFPAAGLLYGGGHIPYDHDATLNRGGKEGVYMSCNLDEEYTRQGCLLELYAPTNNDNDVEVDSYFRIFGISVRPVRVK